MSIVFYNRLVLVMWLFDVLALSPNMLVDSFGIHSTLAKYFEFQTTMLLLHPRRNWYSVIDNPGHLILTHASPMRKFEYNISQVTMPVVVISFNHFARIISPDGSPMALQNMWTAVAGQRDLVFMNMLATYIPKADVYKNWTRESTNNWRSISKKTCCIICGWKWAAPNRRPDMITL